MKKNLFFLSMAFLFASSASSFDWPQSTVVQSDQFYSYFGQNRGETISNSLIFSDPSEVKAAEDGFVSIIIGDYQDENDFFPSTLGNAFIINHNDGLLTVYGNIDQSSVKKDFSEFAEIEKGTIIGLSGNTAWQQGHSSLEFQVIDIKNNTAINPRLLMPRVGKELPLYFQEVYLYNKKGNRFKLGPQNVIPAGSYKVYKKRQQIAVPYSTSIFINGTLVDKISYELLRQEDNLICVTGNKNYTKQLLYPDEDLMLLGELTLTPGKSSLQLTLTDILGKEAPAIYILSVY